MADGGPIADVLDADRLAAFCKALPKAELHQHMSGSFRRVRRSILERFFSSWTVDIFTMGLDVPFL